MASLRLKPNSRFWIACYTDHNGVQRQCSTKETSRPKAQRIAEKYESAYKIKLTEAQARKVVSDIYEAIHGEVLFHATTRKFLAEWLASKKVETAPGSHKRYTNAVENLTRGSGFRGLLSYLCDPAKSPEIVGGNVAGRTRDELLREFSATRQANTRIKAPVWHCSLAQPTGFI